MSVIESVTQQLRTAVLSGGIPADAALAESDVAERFGISRPTAKSVIENLVRERLLVRTAHRSARVVRLAPEQVHDVYRSREVIEAAAVRHLAGYRSVPSASVAANAEIAALAEASPQEVVEPDMRFHAALVAELGSRRLGGMYDSLVSEVRLCMTQVQGAALLPTELIVDEHRRILEHIAAGDADAAAALLSEHIGRARDRLIAWLGVAPGR